MPILSKRFIARYFKTNCQRQLRLSMSPDSKDFRHEREELEMPPPQKPRPGIQQIVEEGARWEIEKYGDLQIAFGSWGLLITKQDPTSRRPYQKIELAEYLPTTNAGNFLLEAEFEVTTAFEQAVGIASYRTKYGLKYSGLRPDIIQVLAPATFPAKVTPDGKLIPLNGTDAEKFQLHVIDIKMVAEPSEGYFAEVAYYMMALAGWLIEHKLDDRFVVVAGAIWPGSHDASKLRQAYNRILYDGRQPTVAEMNAALDEDVEPVEFEVFAIRLRQFFTEELPEVLDTPDWRTLPYFLRTSCSRCEYLGYDWPGDNSIQPDHCIPTVQREDDLSQIPQLTPGVRQQLRNHEVTSVRAMADLQFDSAVLDQHQTLRSKRRIFPARAQALSEGVVINPRDVGTSSVMPRLSNLSIYLSADFDAGSGITVAFGLNANWLPPRPFGQDTNTRESQRWSSTVYPIDHRSVDDEQRELLALLVQIREIMTRVSKADEEYNADKEENDRLYTTMQVYIWDNLQLRHITRVIARHLPAIFARDEIRDLAWLFPPDTVLANYELQRPSPITIVQEAVSSLTALPVPFYYTLLDTVNIYHRAATEAQENWQRFFSIHPLFEGALSDQIPSERAHEIWSRSTEPGRRWQEQLRIYEETVKKKLRALQEVTEQLRDDLKGLLKEDAPSLRVKPPRSDKSMSLDGDLWLAYARLDAALTKLAILAQRAMPSYEREAKFISAILTEQITGAEAAAELAYFNLLPANGRRVYRLGSNSRAVKLKKGDFQFALAPNCDGSYLNKSFRWEMRDHPDLQALDPGYRWRMDEATKVTIKDIDRERGFVVVDGKTYKSEDGEVCLLDTLERLGFADFTRNLSLEPTSSDYFTTKVKDCLGQIKNPPIAAPDEKVLRALGLNQPPAKSKRQKAHLPIDDFLWDAKKLDAAPSNLLPIPATQVRAMLEERGVSLTPTQWQAWEEALTTRLEVIWGPPGTGKSRTVQAIILGAFLAAHTAGKPLRVLLSAFTYAAIDNVLLDTYKKLKEMLPPASFTCHRLRSSWREADGEAGSEIDLVPDSKSSKAEALRQSLVERSGLSFVAATAEQTYNLTKAVSGKPLAELFDLILIDEASQMDILHAILPVCALAEGGSVVLAGDPKQLPPIHQAEAPEGLENYVGSVYQYITGRHEVQAIMLDRNYRSNHTLVSFALEAGYERTLSSHSPDLQLRLSEPQPNTQPADWPAGLFWTPLWEEMIDPARPATCFVYRDGESSQWNEFEVDAVAALVQSVYGKVLDGLAEENDPDGNGLVIGSELYTPDRFWQQGIGVVTPHRAQQARIVSRLQQLFGSSVSRLSLISDAVDTVERFQGQQRDIIIASFALGDPDAIAGEEEFLMSLNRFNVMTSRARAKLAVLVSREVVDHLASDMDILRESRLLKVFVESFCAESQAWSFEYTNPQGLTRHIEGQLRYH